MNEQLSSALRPLKGWGDTGPLDFAAAPSQKVKFPIPAGRVVHLNSEGEFEMGAHSTGPAIFLLSGTQDLVEPPKRTLASEAFMQRVGPVPGLQLAGLVALGGFEIETTEIDTQREYLPNDLLTAVCDNNDSSRGGLLTNASRRGKGKVRQYVDAVVAVVSRGNRTNHSGAVTISFWTAWLPVASEE